MHAYTALSMPPPPMVDKGQLFSHDYGLARPPPSADYSDSNNRVSVDEGFNDASGNQLARPPPSADYSDSNNRVSVDEGVNDDSGNRYYKEDVANFDHNPESQLYESDNEKYIPETSNIAASRRDNASFTLA